MTFAADTNVTHLQSWLDGQQCVCSHGALDRQTVTHTDTQTLTTTIPSLAKRRDDGNKQHKFEDIDCLFCV